MFASAATKKCSLNVVISLEALEVGVPPENENEIHPQWITMVIKRSEHQRLETDLEKLKYVPFSKYTEDTVRT